MARGGWDGARGGAEQTARRMLDFVAAAKLEFQSANAYVNSIRGGSEAKKLLSLLIHVKYVSVRRGDTLGRSFD